MEQFIIARTYHFSILFEIKFAKFDRKESVEDEGDGESHWGGRQWWRTLERN